MSVDHELWGAITAADWRTVRCVAGRVGTREDIDAGSAVFCIDTGKPHDAHPLALPCCAVKRLSDGTTAAVVVIQAETFNGGVFVGVRHVGGGNEVCSLDEIELLPLPTDEFFAPPVNPARHA